MRSKHKKKMKGAFNEALPLNFTTKSYAPFEFHNPTYLQHLRDMFKITRN